MNLAECSLSQLTQNLEVADPRASDEAVLWAHMVERKVSGRAGRASAQGRRAHGEAVIVVVPLLARICGRSLSIWNRLRKTASQTVGCSLDEIFHCDLRGCGVKVAQVDAINGCSAVTLSNRVHLWSGRRRAI